VERKRGKMNGAISELKKEYIFFSTSLQRGEKNERARKSADQNGSLAIE